MDGMLTRVVRAAAPWLLGAAVLLLSLAVVDGFMTVRSVTDVRSLWELPGWVVLVPAAASAAVAVTARRWLWPLVAVAAAVWLLFAMWPAAAVASYHAALRLHRRSALLGYVAAAAAVVLAPLLPTGGSAVVVTAALVGLPLLVGLWVRMRRQLVAGLQERAAHLEREQAARSDQARAEERARIAREMHDVVAHKVSLVVLQAGALEVSAPDDATAESAARIRSAGREALTDLREVLGILRTPSQPDGEREPQHTLADIGDLLDRSRAAGLDVRRVDGDGPRPLPAAVDHTAYRVVQEALTNVHKHAGGAPTSVAVRYLPDELEVTVHNDPPAHPAAAAPGSGLGLVGLRERARLLGGTVDASGDPDGGFTVHAKLPAPPVEDAS